ncbi:MAG: hypothetical protein CL798_02945 [Chromatiales bacterium]|nr:hypothetical protein [Chromatiales bacterium]
MWCSSGIKGVGACIELCADRVEAKHLLTILCPPLGAVLFHLWSYLHLGNAAVSGASLGVMLRMNTWRGSNNM